MFFNRKDPPETTQPQPRQVAKVVRKLQGMVLPGGFSKPIGNEHYAVDLVTLIRPCGCHLIVVPSFGLLYYATTSGAEGWSDRCPHEHTPVLSSPEPRAMLPSVDSAIH